MTQFCGIAGLQFIHIYWVYEYPILYVYLKSAGRETMVRPDYSFRPGISLLKVPLLSHVS